MKIAYVISAVSSDNTGMGGHYRSVLTLCESLKEKGVDVTIFTLGDIFPPPFIQEKVPVVHVKFHGLLKLYRDFLNAVSTYNPTHLHAYDNKSFFFARLCARKLNRPVFLTKPGGPNRNRFFPFCRDIIVFSRENGDFLAKRRNLAKASFHHIPNRVTFPKQAIDKVRSLQERLEILDSETVVLRICRIGNYYRQSILQTINLGLALKNSGIACRVIIVGYVQDKSVFEEITTIAANSAVRIDVITDPIYTQRASEIISIADLVVGTGRSLMEAATLGRICFTPILASKTPALVDASNYSQLEATNFSERNEVLGFSSEKDTDKVLHLLSEKSTLLEYKEYITKIAEDRFSVDGAVPRYIQIYNARSSYTGASLPDYIGNLLGVLRFYIPLYLKPKFSSAR